MKCHACGAGVSASGKFCDYCGVAIAVPAVAAAVAPARELPGHAAAVPAGAAEGLDSLWPGPRDPIFQLWNAPAAHPMRWTVFFFPMAWLAGYGAMRAAIGLALIFIASDIASRVLEFVHLRGAGLLSAVVLIFYSYKVAVHAERLVPVRGTFNWGAAIGFMLAYVVLIAVLV